MLLPSSRSVLSVAILAAGLLVLGCSNEGEEPTFEVTGKVTLNGKAMPNGTISFETIPPNGKAPVVAKIADGTYSATVPAGKQLVQFSLEKQVPSTMAGEEGQTVAKETLHSRYNRTSKITMEVTAGKDNVFDYQLKSR